MKLINALIYETILKYKYMFYETLELSKLIGVDIHKREVNGQIEKCLSIPIRLNGIRESSANKYFMNLLLIERRANRKNNTHYVSLYFMDKQLKSELVSLGYSRNIKYIGFVQNSLYSWNKSNK